LILRELAEQKEKEDELRLHWKDMGLDVVDRSVLYDEQVNDCELHPIITAEYSSKNSGVLPREATIAPASLETEIEPVSKVPITNSAPVENKWISSNAYASSVKKVDNLKMEVKVSSPNVEEPVRSAKVQPLKDDDGEDEPKFFFAPQQESLIEREIRAAREREDELRQLRGLPPLLAFDERDSAVVQISIVKPRAQTEPTDQKAAMKKYSESRLQVELKKEKERELALLRQGSIHTLSEERVGEPVKFVEIISPETELILQAKAKEKAEQKQKLEAEKQSKENEQQRRNTSDSPSSLVNTRPTAATQETKIAASSTKQSPITNQPVKSPTTFTSFTVSKSLPKVLVTYSYAPQDEVDSAHVVTRTEAELRIEQEIAEVMRRDEELRMMHEMLKTELENASRKDSTEFL